MAINFENDLGEWNNDGTEPSDSLREKGFVGGYKPPASVFNWFWSNVIKCTNEIKTNIKSLESSLNSHNHALTSGNITGTLPITKGGTGGTTASSARSNLGLGSAAVKTYVDTVTEGGTGLPTGGAVYTALSKKSDTGHTHTFDDLTGAMVKIINDNAERYFYIANWRYTGYDRLCLGYVLKSTNENVALCDYTSTDNKINSFVDLAVNGVTVLTKNDITSTIANGNTSAISSGAVYTALLNKAAATHTHALNDSTITGTLPITKGGTGAVSVSGARSALGLGTAAQQSYTNTVSAESTALPTSKAVYDAISNTKTKTHIIVATYNTQNPLKANADYTCTSTNASSVLKTAINAVAKGGKIELLDGTYQLQYDDDAIEITKAITIVGSGNSTEIRQPIDDKAGEAKAVFKITGSDTRIKSLMISDAVVSSPVTMIEQSADSVTYDDVFFIYKASAEECNNHCVIGSGNCDYTRIQNCRVYKGFDNTNKVMFDYGSCTSLDGVVIGANISSGYNNISVRFANDTQKNHTTLYGQTTDTKVG